MAEQHTFIRYVSKDTGTSVVYGLGFIPVEIALGPKLNAQYENGERCCIRGFPFLHVRDDGDPDFYLGIIYTDIGIAFPMDKVAELAGLEESRRIFKEARVAAVGPHGDVAVRVFERLEKYARFVRDMKTIDRVERVDYVFGNYIKTIARKYEEDLENFRRAGGSLQDDVPGFEMI